VCVCVWNLVSRNTREKITLMAFKMERKKEVNRGWGRMDSEELHIVCCLSDIVRIDILHRMR